MNSLIRLQFYCQVLLTWQFGTMRARATCCASENGPCRQDLDAKVIDSQDTLSFCLVRSIETVAISVSTPERLPVSEAGEEGEPLREMEGSRRSCEDA